MPCPTRLTLLCATGVLLAGIAGPAVAQQGAPQPAPPAAAPAQGEAQPNAAPVVPTEQWKAPSGCPYRNQKLELIA